VTRKRKARPDGEDGQFPEQSAFAKWIQIVAVIIALLSPVLAYIGGRQGVKGAADLEQSGRDRTLDDATRTQRADVYPKFLEAANAYWLSTNETADDFAVCVKKRPVPQCGGYLETSSFLKPRADFQGTVTKVYVFGSDNAWVAAQAVAHSLPPASGYLNAADFQSHSDDFIEAYQEFLIVMCDELPARSRPGCPSPTTTPTPSPSPSR
jgi:hypothetical protein